MILYVKPGCPWCDDAEEWLETRGFAYRRVDVISDRAAYSRMREISGQTLAPTLEMMDGEVLPDFDTGQLEKFLRRRGDLR